VPVLFRQLCGWLGLRNSGVVYQYIQPPELTLDLLKQVTDSLDVSNVEGKAD